MYILEKAWLTSLSLIAGFSSEAIRADTDEWNSCPGHTGSTITAHIHLTVITWREREGGVTVYFVILIFVFNSQNFINLTYTQSN